jgi:hypothetical protein
VIKDVSIPMPLDALADLKKIGHKKFVFGTM